MPPSEVPSPDCDTNTYTYIHVLIPGADAIFYFANCIIIYYLRYIKQILEEEHNILNR